MSEMVERAAKAIFESSPTMREVGWSGADATARKYARAALLAALDPEDEALVERVAKRMILARNQGDDRLAGFVLTWDREPALADARAAIAALKAAAQGGSVE